MDRTQLVLTSPSSQPALSRRTCAVPPPTPADAKAGRNEVLNDRYALGAVLASSPRWDLYRADDLLRKTSCSVKRSRGGAASDALRLCLREAQILAKLEHLHIARLLECNKDEDGAAFLALEALSGRGLGGLLRSAGRLQLPRALEILRAAAAGLQHAHDRAVVHGNLTPASIFLSIDRSGTGGGPAREVIKLLDFGFARDLAASQPNGIAPSSLELPMEGLAYRAPEVVQGGRAALDARSDQWSLAVVAYQVLSGRLPFAGADAQQLAAQIGAAAADPIEELVPDLPAYVAPAIRRALSVERAERYPSVIDFIRALEGQPPVERIPAVSGEMTVQGFRPDLVALCRGATPSDGIPIVIEEVTTRPYPDELFVSQILAPSQQTIGPGEAALAGPHLEAQRRWLAPSWLLGLTALLATLSAAFAAQSVYRGHSRRALHSMLARWAPPAPVSPLSALETGSRPTAGVPVAPTPLAQPASPPELACVRPQSKGAPYATAPERRRGHRAERAVRMAVLIPPLRFGDEAVSAAEEADKAPADAAPEPRRITLVD
ncbi:MAG: serine/threonine-protein kinase [Polyangia bacterium]